MKILIAAPIDEQCKKDLEKFGEVVFEKYPDERRLIKLIKDFDVLIVRSKPKVTKKVLSAGKKLKLIIRAGIGLDNIDVTAAEKLGIKIRNTPTAPTKAVAEFTISLMLTLLRKVCKANAAMKNEKWLKSELIGNELYGKCLGIIGAGRIGCEVAKLGDAFGMKVLYYDIRENGSYKKYNMERVELNELLREADVVTIHVPLTNETKGMIGKNEIDVMKNGSYLINTSRGKIVKERDLLHALKSGKLAGVALDVYSLEPPFENKVLKELISLDNVVTTPHIAGSTFESQRRIGRQIIEIVKEELKQNTN